MRGPLNWFVNAGRRTVVALVPTLARPDDEFARQWLEPNEYRLYLRMDKRDRQHACLVARALLSRRPEAPAEVVRAALLHDLGKAAAPYNPIYRILVHLYTPDDIPSRPRLKGLRRAWQVNRHHHLYGAAMIREAGGDSEVARLVERHHQPDGDANARLLKSIDDET